MLGSAAFDSLTELIQYYETNPLFRGKRLKYPVNSEVLKGLGEVSDYMYYTHSCCCYC